MLTTNELRETVERIVAEHPKACNPTQIDNPFACLYLRDKDDWTADAAPRCIVGQSIYELLGIQLTGMNNAVRTILVVCGLGTVSEAGMDWINQLQKVFDATLEGDAERRTWSAALETAQEQYWYNRSDQDFLPI